MGNPYEGQVDKSMAPSDLSWHYDYEMLLNEFSRRVRELSRDQDERAEDAEDLGDYLDMLHTLLSFRPRTRADIRTRAFEDSVSNLKEKGERIAAWKEAIKDRAPWRRRTSRRAQVTLYPRGYGSSGTRSS